MFFRENEGNDLFRVKKLTEDSPTVLLFTCDLGGSASRMWPKLRRGFDYAEVELSNNLAENSMRPVALGRKNWLHVGSAQSGPKVAAILSVVESCPAWTCPSKTICSPCCLAWPGAISPT
jgi:Transposase IS66 family